MEEHAHDFPVNIRPYLKNVKTPKRQISFRCSALIFLTIFKQGPITA